MKRVAVYYLAEPKTGGWVTYIIHLMATLRKMGYEPTLFKIGKQTQKTFRPWQESVNMKTLSLGDAFKLNRKIPYIIVAMELKDEAVFTAKQMLKKTPGMIIHHGCGQTPEKDFFDFVPAQTVHVGVRQSIKEKINAFGHNCDFILHPYWSSPRTNKAIFPAASISRVDYVKNTHMIAEANVSAKNKVHIYGSENRMYTHQKLDTETPAWRDYYFGEFKPEASRDIAAQYKVIVDLTRIKNDGGGLQYTFLEAIDCGCALVLHDDWVQTEGSLLREGLNCRTVKTGNELAALLDSDFDWSPLIKESKNLMALHGVKKIGKQFSAHIEGLSLTNGCG